MNHDPHLGFIIAAYALAFVMVAAMVGAIWVDYLRLKRSLSSLAALKKDRDPDEQGTNRLGPNPQHPEGLD
jgi:heme exporter protein CcmD